MNTEHWIGSVTYKPSISSVFWCVWKYFSCVTFAGIFYTDFSINIINCGKRVWPMLFSLVLYITLVVSSLCCTFSCFGPTHRRDWCNCFAIQCYSYELMNFWSCKLVNLSNQKSSSYWQWQHADLYFHVNLSWRSREMLLGYCLNCLNLMGWFSGESLELLPPDVRFLD